MEFGEKLQELRKNKDMTQEELAEALYVSRTAISKWESGRGYPSIDSLKEISRFFSVSIDELLSAEKGKQDHYNHISDSGNYRSTSSRNGQGSLWSFNAVSDDCGKGNCDLQNEINHVFQEGLCQSI